MAVHRSTPKHKPGDTLGDAERAQEWLRQHKMTCPGCGTTEQWMDTKFLRVAPQPKGLMELHDTADPHTEFVTFTCQKCGFTAFIHKSKLGPAVAK